MTHFGELLKLAASPKIIVRAIKMAAVVGCVLAAINHGDALVRGEVTRDRLAKILLTFCVPYLVSTVSSVAAIREFQRENARKLSTKDE